MAADSGIDPRYAAQFQRGFDPAQHAPVLERRGPVPIAAAAPPVVQRVAPPPARVEHPGAAHAAARAGEPDGQDADEPDYLPAVRWHLALPVLAVVLIVVAAVVFGVSATDASYYNGGASAEEYAINGMRMLLPGPLFVAGILALTVWLVGRGLDRRGTR